MNPATRDVSRPGTLTPRDQMAYISMRGVQAWGMLRRGMSHGLILEMFAAPEPATVFAGGILEVVEQCLGTAQFPSTDELATYIWHAIEASPAEFVAADFARQRYTFSMPPVGDLIQGWGHDPHDVRVCWIDKVMTFMLTDFFVADPHVSQAYREVMQDIWFEICDAALTKSAVAA